MAALRPRQAQAGQAQAGQAQAGQAMTEYVLALFLVTLIYALMVRQFKVLSLADHLLAPIKTQYAATYRYGHPKAKGPDDGAAVLHPRATSSGNFRLFINPEIQR